MRSAQNTIAIDVHNLVTAFGSHVVHDQLNLQVYQGEMLSIVGGSGTGKTVLLRHLIGLNKPFAGEIRIQGKVLSAGNAMDADLSRRIGVCFQSGALFSALTVLENVATPLRELGRIPPAVVRSIAREKILQVGLKDSDLDKYPSSLSGGMIKRVALARALVLDPDFLFLDEPTAGLDPEGSEAFVQLLQKIYHNNQFTMIMITHDLDTLVSLSQRVAVLADKKVIICDKIQEVVRLKHPFIDGFFLGPRGQRALLALTEMGNLHGK